MSLDASIMAQPGPSRSPSASPRPATVKHATSRPLFKGRSAENAEPVVTGDPQAAVPVTTDDAKTSVATTLPPTTSPPARHSSSPPSVTSAAQPSLPSSFVTAPSMDSSPVATSSAVRLEAAPATPEHTSPSPSPSPSLQPSLTSPSALASALGYTGPLAGYLASFTARHAGSAPATPTPPRDANAPVDAPAASDAEPPASTTDEAPDPSIQGAPSTEDRPAVDAVPTLPPDSGPMDDEATVPEQAPGPQSPRAEGADALNPPLSSLNPSPDLRLSPATATEVISTTMATSTVLATSGSEQVTTTLVEETLVVTAEAGVAPDAPSSPPTGDTTKSISPRVLEDSPAPASPPASPPQATLVAAPEQAEPAPASPLASLQVPGEPPLPILPASPVPEGTGSPSVSQAVSPLAASAVPVAPSAVTRDAASVTTGPPVGSAAASAPIGPDPAAPAFAGVAAASPAPMEQVTATATASRPASPDVALPPTALKWLPAPAGPSSAAQMGSPVPAEPSSHAPVALAALAGPSLPAKASSSAPLARHSPTPSRTSSPEGPFTTPPQDHERILQPSPSPAREVIVLSPTRSSLTATEAAAALSRPARPAPFGAGPSTPGTPQPRTSGMDVDVVVVDFDEDEDTKPGVTLQRPEPVNRAYVSLRISRERRDELIARGVYDPIRDDDEYRPQPKRKPLASKWFARRAIAVGSDRMRVRSPEEVKDRFIRRAGPAALEPFASALDKDRLLNTLGEYPCGWKGCDSVLASETLLEKHIKVRAHALQGRIEMSDENKLFYRCLWHGCDRPCFEGVQKLLQHISAQHVSNRLLCPFDDCNLHSHTVSHLQRHAERNHDETGGPRPRVDWPWRPPLPDLPPLPGVMRTDALITYPALGTSYKSAGKQEWARARVRRGCFAGEDPEIHIVHPPHMLQPLEGSTAEGTPAVATAEGTPALGNGAENALASGSRTAAVNGTADAPAPSQLRRKERKNRGWGGSAGKAARRAHAPASRSTLTEPIVIPDSDDDTDLDPLAAAMDANTDADADSPADIIPLNAGGHPFQSGLQLTRTIKALPRKRRTKPPTTGPTRTSARTIKGKGNGRARIDCVEIPVRHAWKSGSMAGPPPVAPGKGKGKGKGKERTMRGVAIVDI